MKGINIKNDGFTMGTIVSLFTLTIIVVSTSNMAAPAAATITSTTGNTTMSAATTSNSSSGIDLSPKPVWQERSTTLSMVPINQTHMEATFSGNGTLNPPGSTRSINYTANGTGLISFATQSAQAKETLKTADGDTATASLYEIVKFNSGTGEGRGIVIAVINTNSTGTLAPLNGTIAAGVDDMTPNGESNVKFWQWESGINGSGLSGPPPM